MASTTLTYEPCTLVYTLLDTRIINFNQFYLIVRGNHNFMVDSITPLPDQNTVHVRLGYQASIVNAIKKLGYLSACVCVSKLNSLINQEEYGELEKLRQHFGIVQGATSDPFATIAPPLVHTSTNKRGRGTSRIFASRPAPYKPKKKQVKTSNPEYECPDTQECLLTVPEAGQQSQFYISDPQENEEQVSE